MTLRPHLLMVIRHAKSDWDVPASDRDRPLAKRGRRQAPAIGRWLGEHDLAPALAVVSPAKRAQQTWELVAEQLSVPPPARTEEGVYTFDADALLQVLRDLPERTARVALVGHNPAAEDLVELLCGAYVPLPTSSLAVLDVGDGWARLAAGRSRLLAAGRPADGPLDVYRAGGLQ